MDAPSLFASNRSKFVLTHTVTTAFLSFRTLNVSIRTGVLVVWSECGRFTSHRSVPLYRYERSEDKGFWQFGEGRKVSAGLPVNFSGSVYSIFHILSKVLLSTFSFPEIRSKPRKVKFSRFNFHFTLKTSHNFIDSAQDCRSKK